MFNPDNSYSNPYSCETIIENGYPVEKKDKDKDKNRDKDKKSYDRYIIFT